MELEGNKSLSIPMDTSDVNIFHEEVEEKKETPFLSENVSASRNSSFKNSNTFVQKNTQVNIKNDNSIPHVIEHFKTEKQNLIRDAENAITQEKFKFQEASAVNQNLSQSFENLKTEYISEHNKNQDMGNYITELEKKLGDVNTENQLLRSEGEKVFREKNDLSQKNKALENTIANKSDIYEKTINDLKSLVIEKSPCQFPISPRLAHDTENIFKDEAQDNLGDISQKVHPIDYPSFPCPVDNPNFTLNKFSGVGDVFEWVDHSKQIGILNNWSKNDLYIRIKLSLTGKAYDIINIEERKNPETQNFDNFVEILLKKFQPTDPETHYTEKIVKLCQKKGESGQEYTDRFVAVQQKLERVSGNLLSSKFLRGVFIKGLLQPYKVRLEYFNASTLQKTFACVKKIDRIFELESGKIQI